MREKNQQNKIIDAKMVFVSVEFDVVVGVVTVVSLCPSVGAVGIGANVIQFHLVFGSSGVGLKKVDKQNNVKNWGTMNRRISSPMQGPGRTIHGCQRVSTKPAVLRCQKTHIKGPPKI